MRSADSQLLAADTIRYVCKIMGSIESQLLEILNSDGGERAAHRFLKKNDEIIVAAFNRAWNFKICIPEFELGSEYRVDFLILSAHSANWHAIFIELKDYKTTLYSKNGNPQKALRQAHNQIDNWREWVRINEPYLRRQFSKILDKVDAPAIWPNEIPNFSPGYSSGSAEIADMRTNINYYYHIVIGRSSTLTPEERKFRQNDMARGGPGIATYDRLLAMAKRIDDYRISSHANP